MSYFVKRSFDFSFCKSFKRTEVPCELDNEADRLRRPAFIQDCREVVHLDEFL